MRRVTVVRAGRGPGDTRGPGPGPGPGNEPVVLAGASYHRSTRPLFVSDTGGEAYPGRGTWIRAAAEEWASPKEVVVPIVYSNVEAGISDRERRRSLFVGNLFVYSPRPSSLALCGAARSMLQEHFGQEPTTAQQRLDDRAFSAQFAAAARQFQRLAPPLVCAAIADFGCDPDTTYFGMPLLAAFTGQGFVAQSLGVPGHPHRDLWYAASPSQINWWMPLDDVDDSYALTFHPRYWDSPIQNNSSAFDFASWDDPARADQRLATAEPFGQPRPLAPIDLAPDLRISCSTGGLILSSVAQLYSTLPNETLQTHFSAHFQTVSEEDLVSGIGAPNPDAAPRGSSLSAFVRCSDLEPISEALVDQEVRRRADGRPPS